jgi:DNA-binding MarR family transcriptional regulator
MSDRANRATEQWQQERPDIDAAVMALVGRLLEATHLIERDWLYPLATQFELHQGEFDVIATLRRSGQPYGLTPTALYESLMLSSGAMTSRLDRLENKGLIERGRAPEDRRSILVRLTPAGLALIDKILPLHVANEQQALSALSLNEQTQLNDLLAKLLIGLNQKI